MYRLLKVNTHTLLQDTLDALPCHKPSSRYIPRLVNKTSLKHQQQTYSSAPIINAGMFSEYISASSQAELHLQSQIKRARKWALDFSKSILSTEHTQLSDKLVKIGATRIESLKSLFLSPY